MENSIPHLYTADICNNYQKNLCVAQLNIKASFCNKSLAIYIGSYNYSIIIYFFIKIVLLSNVVLLNRSIIQNTNKM